MTDLAQEIWVVHGNCRYEYGGNWQRNGRQADG